ncbi:MAG TPA: hypothetical protein VFK05_22220 [Polyangiaceae bacterium]|nr:hypothetical protein [Polyangiaceae bacterium]
MGERRLGLSAAILGGVLSATAVARSYPSIAIHDVGRELPHGNLQPTQINRADCLADDSVVMTIELSEHSDFLLEVWAGVACDVLSSRRGATATCWKVFAEQPPDTTFEINLRVRDLLFGRTKASSAKAGAPPTGNEACEGVSGAVGAQLLSTYVMLIDASEMVAGYAMVKFQYRLKGPPPPEHVFTSGGDGQLLVDFEYGADISQEIAGFQLFCDPPPNAAAVSEAPAVSDVPDGICQASSELVADAAADSLGQLRCGSMSLPATRGIAEGLVNGTPYNVSVATVDTFGNVGPLSPPACGVPRAKPPADAVRACSFAGTAAGQLGSPLILSVLGAAFARRRRSRLRDARQ